MRILSSSFRNTPLIIDMKSSHRLTRNLENCGRPLIFLDEVEGRTYVGETREPTSDVARRRSKAGEFNPA
jgi:hypothetical protein